MAVTCPDCGHEYDITLFQFGRTVRCACGRTVSGEEPRSSRADPRAEELRRRADGVTDLILYSEMPRVDVEIAMNELREWVAAHMPDKLKLFEMIYERRWQRLEEQGWAHERPER